MTGIMVFPAQAASSEDIEDSIELGIAWLADQQNTSGAWGAYETVALTGFAVLKLEDRAFELGYESPFDPEYEYSSNVTAGLNYIFGQAYSACSGIQFGSGHHENYATAVAMMAIAASRDLDREVDVTGSVVDGWTYMDILEANVDWMINTQRIRALADDGGWGYGCGESPERPDNSNTGWAVLALRYAQDSGIDIPDVVSDNLSAYIDYIQNDVSGGSGYDTPGNWVNVLKTGNLLFEMAFVGDTTSTPRVQDAIDYIEEHWNDNGGGSIYGEGWQPHNYQAMYCLMKGFESLSIDTIEVGSTEVDWFDEISTYIVNNQYPGGYWTGDPWGSGLDPVLSTVFALLTLQKVAPPPPQVEVSVDIKPTSCPNPLNVGRKGVLPVAILGTEEFDVTQVDPSSVFVTMEGLEEEVSPLRWAMEDVATPYADEEDGCYACTEEGPDGYMDLTLKFKSQEVVIMLDLDQFNNGDCAVLVIKGNLKEEFGRTPIAGEDVIRIIKK
jgi:hypothetical protein